MQGSVDGGMSRGMPRTPWLDNIKTWMGKTSEELNRLSQDRRMWKEISFVATSNTVTQ